MDKNLEALDQLIDEAVNKEKSLAVRADELALQNKQFAEYLAEKKHNDEALEALWLMVKEYMTSNGIMEHENEFIKLKLTPSGKFKATVPLDFVTDDVIETKKVLDNKKVKSYLELHGELPDGVQSTGYILRKTLK